jgi:hypothetical protein
MNDPLLLTPAGQVVAGLLVLLLGRRIFWLFVGLVGFFLGAQASTQIFPDMADGVLLLVALAVGLVGAVLAILLQRLAVTMAGAIAGGMLAVRIAPLAGLHTEAGVIAAFVAGALVAAVVLAVLFDPALIVISALIGGVMAAEAFPIDPSVEPFVLVVLVALGIAIQARQFSRRAYATRDD